MKFYLAFTIVFLSLLATSLTGQNELTQSISGIITDQQAGSPLLGASVELLDVSGEFLEGTTTSENGQFTFAKVPMGRHQIRISYLGYESTLLANVVVQSGKSVQINAQVREKVTDLPQLVVMARTQEQSAINSMATGSVRMLSIEALQRFSGGFGDPARMVQNYAGVSGANDDRNDIIVRGNSPSAVLWRLEGIDIPSPNHWSTLGTTGGPVSMLNANNLRNSDFFSGAFPAEYGNATAAVFDLNLRNGNAEKFEFLGQLGFNGFEFGTEGPLNIGQNASFVTNFRYSTLGLFQKIGINFGTGAAIPQYRDGVFKVNIPTQNSGTFSVWGLGGISDITFYDSGDNIYTEGSGQINSGSRTGVVGLSHLLFLNPTTSSKVSLAVAGSTSTNTSAEIDNGQDPPSFVENYRSNYDQTKYALNWTVNKKFNAKHRIKTGVIAAYYDLKLDDAFRTDNSEWQQETAFGGSFSFLRSFAQWQYQLSDEWTVNAGLHASWLTYNNSTALEPRTSIRYQAHPRHSLALGYGQHSQLQPLPVYFATERDAEPDAIAANQALDYSRSNHYTFTYTYSAREDISLKLEAYYQDLSGLAVDPEPSSFSMINAGADFGFPNRLGLVNEGFGKNTGLEFTLEKDLRDDYYLLFTASVFDSQYQGSDGQWHNTYFNSNYVTNLLFGKEFVFNKKWKLSLDTRGSYAGGRRYTPIDIAASRAAGQEVRDYTQVYEASLAPYFRLDFKIGVQNNEKRYSQLWAIDLVNISGRANEFRKSFHAESGGILTTFQRGFFPNVLYQIHF